MAYYWKVFHWSNAVVAAVAAVAADPAVGAQTGADGKGVDVDLREVAVLTAPKQEVDCVQTAWMAHQKYCGLVQGFLAENLDAILFRDRCHSKVPLPDGDGPFPDPTVGVHDEAGNVV